MPKAPGHVSGAFCMVDSQGVDQKGSAKIVLCAEPYRAQHPY